MPDKYLSLAALKAQLQEGVHYRTRVINRNSPVTVLSLHGGFIEEGTSELAAAVASRSYNLFDFQGLRKEAPEELHVTSTRFRDPLLSELLDKSQVALSIHCMGSAGSAITWLGGLNAELKQSVLCELQHRGFLLNPDSPKYRGESPLNVVNLPARKGVQLELSQELLSTMFAGVRFDASGKRPRCNRAFASFVTGLKRALARYLSRMQEVA